MAGEMGRTVRLRDGPVLLAGQSPDVRPSPTMTLHKRTMPRQNGGHSAASASASAKEGWTRQLSTTSLTFRPAVTASDHRDELGRLAADDAAAEDDASGRVGDYLYETHGGRRL